MAACVYPDCDGDLRSHGDAGFCSGCLRPVRTCGHCSAWNRGLAVCCRICGQTTGNYPADCSSLDGAGGWDRLTRCEVVVRENIWSAPKSHGGYLWFLTESGQLCRYSPFDRRYSEQFAFGTGSCYSTLLIRDLVRTQNGPRSPITEPFALVVSPTALIAFGLLSRTRIELNPPNAADHFLNDAVQGFHCLDATEDGVWCLAENPVEGISLVRANMASAQCQKWPLGMNQAVGPVVVGEAVAAWSEDELVLFDKGQIRRSSFPQGFSPSMAPSMSPRLRGGLGHPPAIVCRSDFYVPGSFHDRPAFANFHLVDGAVGAMATLPLHGSSAYFHDRESCLLVASDGSLERYEQTNPKSLWRDGQLRCDRLPFSDGNFHVGFVEAAGGELLRMHGSRGTSDTNLPPEHRILDTHGFHVAGPALLCTYTSAEDSGIISWHA